ncbi:MAG: hypothetical protein IPK80_02495 [Nannocystis sp.]|nr:hypothetical protein [Nannocystis sp.]
MSAPDFGDGYRVHECRLTMHCDVCGARLAMMRVEYTRATGEHRFVCPTHELPDHLVGREYVRVKRDGQWIDVWAHEVRPGEERAS